MDRGVTEPVRPLLQDSFDFIAQSAAGAEIHAGIVQRYAAAGDLTGLRYAVSCMCAYIRACNGGIEAIDQIAEHLAAKLMKTERTGPGADAE